MPSPALTSDSGTAKPSLAQQMPSPAIPSAPCTAYPRLPRLDGTGAPNPVSPSPRSAPLHAVPGLPRLAWTRRTAPCEDVLDVPRIPKQDRPYQDSTATTHATLTSPCWPRDDCPTVPRLSTTGPDPHGLAGPRLTPAALPGRAQHYLPVPPRNWPWLPSLARTFLTRPGLDCRATTHLTKPSAALPRLDLRRNSKTATRSPPNRD